MKVLYSLIMLGGGLLAALAAIVQIFARFLRFPGIARASGAFTVRWARPGALSSCSSWAKPRLWPGPGSPLDCCWAEFLGLLAHTWLQAQRAFPFIEADWSKTALAILVTSAAFGLVALVAAWWPARQSGRIRALVGHGHGRYRLRIAGCCYRR